MSEPRGRGVVLALLLSSGSVRGATADPEAMLRRADAPRAALEEGVIRVRAALDGQRTELDVYVQGEDRVLCVFRDGAQQGRRVLTSGNRMWLLLPKAKRPIPVSPNQRLLGGASTVDVARLRFAEEFTATLRDGSEQVDGETCQVLDLRARTRKAAYASGVLWIGAADGLPRKVRLALRSGKEAKEIVFSGYDRERGRTVLRRMEVRSLIPADRGLVTRLEFLRYESRKLDPTIFDPQGARALQ